MKSLLMVGAIAFGLLVLSMVASVHSDQQASAGKPLNELGKFAPVNLPSLVSGNHEGYCTEAWTKRGVLDYRMYDYCLSQETTGYKNLQQLVSQHSNVPFLSAIVDSAIVKWTSKGQRQDRMVEHTVSREIESYLDMQYEATQVTFDRQKFDRCSSKWGIQYSMTSYCYKNK